MLSSGQAEYRVQFEISPITLIGGIAANLPGGTMPILSIINAMSFGTEGIQGGGGIDLDDAFAYFYPMPGTTLIEQQVGMYPFANLVVAANTVIEQPLRVDMLMTCPVRDAQSYGQKLSVMTSLQSTLYQHNISGGTYTVATPVFFFVNTIMTEMVDVSGGETLQAQIRWKLSFIRPLVSSGSPNPTQTISLNAPMALFQSGVQFDGSTSGIGMTVGQPQTLATPPVSPASQASSSSATVQ